MDVWQLDHKEGWALKNWCFRIVALEKLFRVSWTAKRSNQSVLKEINPEYSLEGLMVKLKLQYFGHFMWRAFSLEKTLIWGRLRAGFHMRHLDFTFYSFISSLGKIVLKEVHDDSLLLANICKKMSHLTLRTGMLYYPVTCCCALFS